MVKKRLPSIFIIILNWNKPELTVECLKSIRKLRIENYELSVVVVDNGSTDDSTVILKKSKFLTFGFVKGRYKLLVNKTNLGFAEGNNVGIRHALENGADYILLLNNDTEVDENLISEFIKAAEVNPKAGIFSPKIYFAKGFEFHKKRYDRRELGKVIWAVGGDIDWDNVYGTNSGIDHVDTGQFEKKRNIDFATGACVFIRASTLKDIGVFNKKYFMYFEDVDLSMRAIRKHWKVLYVPKAFLWHKVAQSSEIGGGLNDYFLTRNRLFFGMRYAPLRTKFALLKESFILAGSGRKWQKIGAIDFYLRRFGKGSWKISSK